MELLFIILLSLFVLVFVHVLSLLVWTARMQYKLRGVPAPSGRLPLLGHALQLIGVKPWEKMRVWCSTIGIDGALFQFSMFCAPVVYCSQPQILRRVLQTNQRNYCKDIAFSYKHFMCLLGTGLVTAEGELWRRGRLLLTHALRIDILDEVPRMAIGSLQVVLDRFKDADTVLDLNEEFRHLTLRVISQAAVSFSAERGDEVFARLYLPVVHECNRRVWAPHRVYMPWLKGCREQRRCLAELNQVLDKTICERWEARKSGEKIERPLDILDKCMEQIDELTPSLILQLRDDVKTMLLAGHETSAALLTWATYEVMRHPEIERELVAEAETVFGEYIRAGTLPPVELVKKLRWAPAVISEALRLHTVVPCTMRYTIKDDLIPAHESGLPHDIVIPSGAIVGVSINGVHMRPDIYPEPEKFRPERFFEDACEERDPYAYLPFINGPRGCLGKQLALTETQMVLSYLFYHLHLSLPKNSKLTLEEVGEMHDYTVPVVPKYGLNVVASKRE